MGTLFFPPSFIEGFLLGISLIAAIGAQNIFVLRQGLTGNHLFMTAGICALCDSLLISCGSLGIGSLVAGIAWLRVAAVISGLFFLCYYAAKSFLQAFRHNSQIVLAVADGSIVTRKRLMLSALGFSLLNPHAVLDTVVLIGGLSGQFDELESRFFFASGAISASVVWFFSIAYGACFMRPLFRNPYFAAGLDIFVGTIMSWAAWSLIQSELL